MSEVYLSPVSCSTCRKAHKKCDKKLGKCGRCARLGKECTYQTKQVVKAYSPYSETALLPYSKLPVFDSSSLPTQESLDDKLLRIFDTAMSEASKVHVEEKVVYYTFRALLSKLNGDDAEALIMLNNSKPVILSRIDQVATDSIVASCCLYLAYYFLLERDSDRVTFFLAAVKQFIDKHRTTKSNLIEIMYNQLAKSMSGYLDFEYILKSFIVQYGMFYNYLVKTNKIVDHESLVNEQELELISYDLRNGTNYFMLNNARIVAIAEKIPTFFHSLLKERLNLYISNDNLLINMIVEELRFKFDDNGKTEILHMGTEIALSALFGSENSDVLFVGGLKTAVKSHLTTMSKICYASSCDLSTCLRKELKAVSMLRNIPNYSNCEPLMDIALKHLQAPISPQLAIPIQDQIISPFEPSWDLLDKFFDEFLTE
jgi:hypothetical protein